MIILPSNFFLTDSLFVFILVGFTSCFYFWTHLLVVSVLDVFTSCFYFDYIYWLFLLLDKFTCFYFGYVYQLFLFLQHMCWWTVVMHTNKLWCSLWSHWRSSLPYLWWKTLQFHGEMLISPLKGRKLQHRRRECGLCRCYLRGEVQSVGKVTVTYSSVITDPCFWNFYVFRPLKETFREHWFRLDAKV